MRRCQDLHPTVSPRQRPGGPTLVRVKLTGYRLRSRHVQILVYVLYGSRSGPYTSHTSRLLDAQGSLQFASSVCRGRVYSAGFNPVLCPS